MRISDWRSDGCSSDLHAHAVACRTVDGGQQLERLQPGTAVGFGLGHAAHHVNDITIVERMAKAIDRRRLVARLGDSRIVGMRFGDLPLFDIVDRAATDPRGPLLAHATGSASGRVRGSHYVSISVSAVSLQY